MFEVHWTQLSAQHYPKEFFETYYGLKHYVQILFPVESVVHVLHVYGQQLFDSTDLPFKPIIFFFFSEKNKI